MSSTTITRIARAATLEEFASATAGAERLHLRDLEPMTTLFVRTKNSVYRLVIVGEGTVLVEGGRFFPSVTAASLEGASLGGNLLKIGCIAIGFRMEICAAGERVVTSPVAAITIERPASLSVH